MFGFSLKSIIDKVDMRRDGLVAAALLFALLPLETSHLLSMVLGAGAYLLLQMLHPKVQQKPKLQQCPHDETQGPSRRPQKIAKPKEAQDKEPEVKELVRKPSVMPVAAPTFQATGFQAEVEELLLHMAPSRDSDMCVATIAQKVKKAIQRSFPTAEVEGFSCCNPLSSKAFGVAVPEVEIVVTTHLEGYLIKAQKSAVRTCTDLLVSSGFKFRRSAFKGSEPKVTLVVQVQEFSIPINVSVNATTPQRCARLVTEVGKQSLQARDAILLVRRWAKDRGLSHAAKGHFSPYCWTLLAINALQMKEELPALGARSAAELFEVIISFYAVFDWSKPVDVWSAHRGVWAELGAQGSEPHIQDPFDPSTTTSGNMDRVRAEFLRAQDLLGKGSSLSQLLEPWAPDAPAEESGSN